jgi:outer membrane protein OmpA-like peptidoglycan-associated protein
MRLIALAVVLTGAARLAGAEPMQVGGWFGPRVYSTDSTLGYIDNAPQHPVLSDAVELGGRIGRSFYYPWLFPEAELAIAPTHTSTFMTSVFWMEPRVQVRVELAPLLKLDLAEGRLMPFALVGGGAPIALSGARRTFDSGITGDGYLGGGARFDTQKGFAFRLDARVAILPGVNHAITSELDIGIGIELALGAPPQKTEPPPDMVSDRDGDGIPDAIDKCPDQPEDKDGFEDADGCPDIDNDMDHILDIADKCPNEPETYNGFEDDDGCPDTVPADVDAIRGTVEGLIYAEGETAVHGTAQKALKKIAKVMEVHPNIKVVFVGHTDDREAKMFAKQTGSAETDISQLSIDLSVARAEAARQALIAIGVASGRVTVEGKGADQPVADNDKPRGRGANRRVELKLFIAQR